MQRGRGKHWSKSAGQALELAFGMAALCVLPLAEPLIDPNHLLVYHFSGPAYRLFAKVFIDWAALWLGMAAFLLFCRWQAALRTALVLLTPWILLEDWSLIRVWHVPRAISAGLLLLPAGGAIALRLKRDGQSDARVLELSGAVLKALSLSGCVMLLQMVYCAFAARGLTGREGYSLGAAKDGGGQPARVVVVLFDELSHAQVFGGRTRAAGANAADLPAFARMARESVVFAEVRPESDQTDRAVPALLSGLPVDKVRASADGRELAMRGDSGWTTLRGEETILGDARRAGYRVGVSGWYNPYCRVLKNVVDACAWASPVSAREMGGGSGTMLQDALQPLRRVWREVRLALPGPQPAREEWLTAEHVRDYLAITAAGDGMLRDGRLGFVFLHLPIPHPGGIYDRRTGSLGGGVGSLGTKTGYRDNLALADSYLGHVRQMLEERGDWERATVVVLGDHSWRTRTWRNGAEWTGEDEKASGGGQFDDRPALLVKMGDQTAGMVVTAAFQERRIRALLAGVEGGELRTAVAVERWAVRDSADKRSVKR